MKITFIGANHEVTGSKTLVEWKDGRYFLVDYGMEQGQNLYENIPLPVPAASIDYVFVTHAHIDHTGHLPLLYKEGFRGKIYATRETTNLCHIMLADSAHIQESDAEYKNRKARRAGKPEIEPLYTQEHAKATMKLFRPCPYKEAIQVDEGLIIRFTDVGHLMGSAAVECWLTDQGETRKIVFSGDIGNLNQPIINDPQPVDEADYLMIESTYGNRLHEKRIDPLPSLVQTIQRTLDDGGNVIIPSFAVGRTQELLYFIREIKQQGLVHGHDGFKVYVDSPLANEATAVFLQCDTSCLDPHARKVMQQGENPIAFDGLETVVTADESKALNASKEPCVIISSSGMCNAGRILHHLKHNIWRPECTVLFVGYQSNGTLGRSIYDGAKSVKIMGDEIAVKCHVALLQGVSGHGDKQCMLNWVDQFQKKPAQIFVNHGEDDAALPFAKELREEFGVKVDVPYSGSQYDLLKGEWIYQAEGVKYRRERKDQQTGMDRRQSAAFQNLLSAVDRLVAAAQNCRGFANKELQRLTDRINSIIHDMKN